ncbi:MAG: GntG family PLP-dependent aldolase [Spirochaetales bacterium]
METMDFRSDTLTRPTPAVREVMARAEVGDDVYGEDPTVNRLQDVTAELLGKEAALFVSSGTMGNLISLYLQAGRGGEVLAHKDSHIIHYELASGAAIAGCQILPASGARGVLTAEVLEPLVRGPIYYNARTTLIEIENTGNLAGGTCYSLAELNALGTWARSRALPVHLDGARLWNAVVATRSSPAALAAVADTVTVCLSKGLGAPVGSVLAGSKAFVAEARRVRKMLGGGMRQAGVLAAAGLYVLEHHRDRLADDHEHARLLAEALQASGWAQVPVAPETNIVFADTPRHESADVVAKLEAHGVRCSAMGAHRVRFVTHLDVSRAATKKACEILASIY